MNRAEFVKVAYAIKPVKLPRSPGAVSGCSGLIDTLGAHKCLLRFIGDHTTVVKRVRVRHASGASTLFTSGTAFTTAIDTSATAGSGQVAWNIDLTGVKRYLIVQVSAITTSANYVVFGDLFYNRTEPTGTTVTAATGQIGTIGFKSITSVTA